MCLFMSFPVPLPAAHCVMDFRVVWGWLDTVLNGYDECFLLHDRVFIYI